mmetsp:Transcript_11076/g.12681  ORF Transcript_11076/g.12681 Transcript_11076/m.12681 type:complete len:182 (-) Transcript_11076:300-845(-)
MTNYYLLFRSLPYLIAGYISMFNVNDWLSVMLGPDYWDYSPEELGVIRDKYYGTMTPSGQRYGIDPILFNEQSMSQSLKYAVSGVGVHLIFIAIVMIYLGMILSSKDKRPPMALLILDFLTIANATGSFQQDTAGHYIIPFVLVLAIDMIWMLITIVFPGTGTTTQTTTSNKNNKKNDKSD